MEIEYPEVVGTLAMLPEETIKTIKAYAKAAIVVNIRTTEQERDQLRSQLNAAQQSPAVAVPECVIADIKELIDFANQNSVAGSTTIPRHKVVEYLQLLIDVANGSSPHITEQDDDGLLPIDAGSHPDCRVMRWSELELLAIKDYARRCISAAKTQRITEQDAREIASSALEHVAGFQGFELNYWMENYGRALLDKLNGVSHEN